MNVDDGRLIRLAEGQPVPNGFTAVPDELHAEAEELMARAEAMNEPAVVDMSLKTPIVKWAKHQRKKNKKARAKMAKASRKANRRK